MLLLTHMGMLTRQDLKQIGDLLVQNNRVLKTEIVTEVVEQVGDMIEQNFLPAVDVLMEDKLKPIKEDIVGIKKDATGIKATMVTKDYLDEKLGGIKGKINVLVDVLHQNKAVTEAQRAIVRAA